MRPDDLANLLRSHMQANGVLELTVAVLPELAPILQSLQITTLTITDAKLQVATSKAFDGPLPAQVRVDGQTTFPGMHALQATCFFATTDQLKICVQAHLPTGWKITDSIPNIPRSMRQVTPKSSMMTLQKSLLADLQYQEAQWLVTNYADPAAHLNVGLNLSARVMTQAVLADAHPDISIEPVLKLQGFVQLPSSPTELASLLLYAQSEAKPLKVGPITLSHVRIRIRTTSAEETAVQEARVEVGGTIAIGKPNPALLEIWTPLYPGAGTRYFIGQAQDSSLSIGNGMKALVDLVGGNESDFQLPRTLQTLGNIHVQAFSVGLDLNQKSIEHVSLTVGSDARWSLVSDSVSIENLSLNWFVLFPLNKQFRYNSINIAGVLSFGRGQNAIKFDIEAQKDSGFRIAGALSQGQVLHVTDVIEAALDVKADLPALDIDRLYIEATSSGDYFVGVDSPTVWQIPLGITSVAFGRLALAVTHSGSGDPATQAILSGMVSVAGSQFVGTYDTRGNLLISGTLPNIDLRALLADIIGDVISYPPSFPAIELENSRISIQKAQQDYFCEVSTTVDRWGIILVEAAKRNNQWGAAAGIALPRGWKLSSLTSLPVFDSFSFSSLALVVSSFRDPAYIFPGNSIPAINGVVEGVNFYADLALDGALLSTIGKIIGESSLQIRAAIGAQDTFLSASLSKSLNVPPVSNLPLSSGGTEGGNHPIHTPETPLGKHHGRAHGAGRQSAAQSDWRINYC